jgi:hypothetical protein
VFFDLDPELAGRSGQKERLEGVIQSAFWRKDRANRDGMKKHVGTFSTVTDEAIQMREGSNDVGIPKENVARVTVLDKSHRLRNSLLFGAVGAGAGAGITTAATRCSSSNNTFNFCGFGGGLAVGVGGRWVGGWCRRRSRNTESSDNLSSRACQIEHSALTHQQIAREGTQRGSETRNECWKDA